VRLGPTGPEAKAPIVEVGSCFPASCPNGQ
jgi:hypothetical protein